MKNSIIQELNAEADRIIGNKLLRAKFFFSLHLSSYLHKSCLIS